MSGPKTSVTTTTAAAAASAPVSWRRLAWVAWRQHRAALAVALAVVGLAAALLVAAALLRTELPLLRGHWAYTGPWDAANETRIASSVVLQLLPVLGGMFLGAPLVARELEARTARMTWAQGAGRTRWLIAQAAVLAGLLGAAALALAFLAQWGLYWRNPFGPADWDFTFMQNPLPFAGWTVAGFCLGVFLGAALRRTVPAMAATVACYVALMLATLDWRGHYLPPLYHFTAHLPYPGDSFAGADFGSQFYFSTPGGHVTDVLDARLGFPDGRLLSNAQAWRSAAWFRAHHVGMWVTYQPGSRYGLFDVIEFGWLAALSVILVAATVVLIRRRAA
ncbi:MAG TPA: hypothetical protein VF834_01645 [Streptosporangiaceae bacterium]